MRFHDPWPYPGQILHLACCHNNVDLLRWLLNEPNVKEYCFTANSAGYTPLLTAVFYNAETCVEELIKVRIFYFLPNIAEQTIIDGEK